MKNNLAETQKEKVLNPTVVKLGLVSFFADVSSEMLYPITPIFLLSLGASMSSIGLIEGLAEAIASLMKTFSGTWSDNIQKRKPFIAFGYFLAALAKPLTGLATNWSLVLFARSLDRTGKGIRGAPRDALLSEAVLPQHRGEAFGWHRAMDTMGAAVGPLLAILYLNYFKDNLSTIYYLALIPGMLSVFFVLRIKESPLKIKKETKPFELNLGQLPKSFKTFVFCWTVFAITNSSDVFLLLKARQQGLGLTEVILIYCFYNLFYALASPYLGKLSDKIARYKILILGLVIFAAVYYGFTVATKSWHFWFLFLCYGIYMAATDGVSKAMALDLIQKNASHLKASALGLLGTATGIATFIASLSAGLLWDHYGANGPFIFGASGAILSILFILKFARTQTAAAQVNNLLKVE